LGLAGLRKSLGLVAGHLLRGQTNFLRMIWKFNQVYNAQRQYGDHFRPVKYEMKPPPKRKATFTASTLYVHADQRSPKREPVLESQR